MNVINLLPKTPFLKRWFALLLAGLLLLIGGSAAAILHSAWNWETETVQLQAEIAGVSADIGKLREVRAADPHVELLRTYRQLVALLEDSRTHWFPLLEGFSATLPQQADILRAEFNAEEGCIDFVAGFANLEDAVGYVQSLEQFPLYQEVSIQQVEYEELGANFMAEQNSHLLNIRLHLSPGAGTEGDRR